MTRLFFAVYAALGVVLLLGVLLVFTLNQPRVAGTWSEPLAAFASFPGIATRSLATAPPDGRGRVLLDLEAQFGHPVTLSPRQVVAAGLADSDRARLARGESVAVVSADEAHLYVPLPAEPFVVGLGPVRRPAQGVGAAPFAILAALLAVAGAVYLLIRPLQTQLTELSRASRQFGRGNFDARAQLGHDVAMGPLGTSFNEMAGKVQTLIESHQELLNAVSHELRGPLQRIRFAVDLLPLARGPEALERRTADIQGDVQELDDLVGELLSWSRLEGGTARVDAEPTDVAALLARIVSESSRLRDTVAVESDIDVPGLLEVDPRLFSRAMTNLASNAARYTRSRVHLTARRVDGVLSVIVDDDGPGVAPADRERIFKPFVRLDDARSRDTGGVGLGLAITRKIAEGHRGTVTVEDGPLGGARFRWTSRT